MSKLISVPVLLTVLFYFSNCKKEKFIVDSSATIELSQDSVLFDTVFTTIGSATENIRIRNLNDQPIRISSIQLEGGASSQFIINVDGASGTNFKDVEIAANDSMYMFIQVNVNPTNQNAPLIVSDKVIFKVNGNTKTLLLEAWGQDAYYHRPDSAIYFEDGSYFPYSVANALPQSYDFIGGEYIWKNDKPHVIYGYFVVDENQKLRINAGTKVYMNYKAGLWVFQGGQIKVLGQKGNEVIFQGARREPEYADKPGQWDRIWINEGSDHNEIDYAIIKNGFIGVQAETFGNTIGGPGRLKITNTRIQNMSKWGLYSLAYNVYSANNVISNCQEHSLNILLGGNYTFLHTQFVNFWHETTREKTTINISNYTDLQVLPMDSCYFGNCIIDGKLDNEVTLDAKSSGTIVPQSIFSSTWMKTNINVSDPAKFINVRTSSGSSLEYVDVSSYDFEPANGETRVKGFNSQKAVNDALKTPIDIRYRSRIPGIISNNITAGAYEK